MHLKLNDLPESVVQHYNIEAKATRDSYVYVKIKQGMYGLPQEGLTIQQLLEKRLNKKGYKQSEITKGFWTHNWHPICFLLCVDDFGVKYVGKQHADHQMTVLGEHKNYLPQSEGKMVLGAESQLGLQKKQSSPFDVGVCNRSTHQIHTQPPPHAVTPTIPVN